MCTIFKSQKFWDMVKHGCEKPVKEEGGALTAAQKLALEESAAKDAKVFGLIQNTVSDEYFSRIALQGCLGDFATRISRR